MGFVSNPQLAAIWFCSHWKTEAWEKKNDKEAKCLKWKKLSLSTVCTCAQQFTESFSGKQNEVGALNTHTCRHRSYLKSLLYSFTIFNSSLLTSSHIFLPEVHSPTPSFLFVFLHFHPRLIKFLSFYLNLQLSSSILNWMERQPVPFVVGFMLPWTSPAAASCQYRSSAGKHIRHCKTCSYWQMTAFAFPTHLQQRSLQDLTEIELFERVSRHNTAFDRSTSTLGQLVAPQQRRALLKFWNQQNQSSSYQGFVEVFHC